MTQEQKDFVDWLNATVPIIPVAAIFHVVPHADAERDQQVYCPFHVNVNTRAAKIYVESNDLHCYGDCGRNYGVYDFYARLGNMTYSAIYEMYQAEYEQHAAEAWETKKHELNRSILESPGATPQQKQTIQDFHDDVITGLLTSEAYQKWKEGKADWSSLTPQMDNILTHFFEGYDYRTVVQG